MMKRFMSTTAVLLMMSGGAYADAHAMGFGQVQLQESDFFASDLIGMRIYNSETEVDTEARIADGGEQEWDDIGEINDIIISQDGSVEAVILGVGGFLGLGERDVSVSMDAIKVVREEGESDDRFLVVQTSKEELENAPAFERAMGDDMNTEEMAENAEAETEEMAENAEAETEEMAENAEAETEEMAENVEAETEEMAENAEAETEEVVQTNTMDRELLPRPTQQRDGYEEIQMEEVTKLNSDNLDGHYVYGANDETVGEIDELIISSDGKLEQVVINVGGFLGLGEKPVAVSFEELQFLKTVDGDDLRIYIDSTEERLEELPEYEN